MYEQIAVQKTLHEKFLEIKMKNPHYSLRAFSNKLGLSSSSVSEILNGKRRISIKMAKRIIQKLELSPRERSNLLELFPKKSKEDVEEIKKTKNIIQLTMDQFKLISDWHHFAILSLSELDHFKSQPMWVAKRLNISISQTVEAIKRLERLNFLKKNEDGTFVNCKKQLSTTDGTPDISLRKAHSHNLMLAQKSLEHDDLSTRDFTAVTMALDPEKLNDAKKMIREFRDKLSLYLSSGKKKEVYKLCVQLFPLTRK